MVYQLPLLDNQYNPTETLRSFSDAVFHYLDTHYEPKGTQLLEPEKMKALLLFFSPPEDAQVSRQVSLVYFSIAFLALSIETVFTAHGPSVTPAGLLAYLRSEIMSDPEESGFLCFKMANKAMRLKHSFTRSQFPPVAEPKAEELQAYIEASFKKALRDVGWYAAAVHDEELVAVKTRIALEQMGEENAQDLISSRICYSCYRNPCICLGGLDLI